MVEISALRSFFQKLLKVQNLASQESKVFGQKWQDFRRLKSSKK